LTEWKRVREASQILQIAREAREQTDRYKEGVLGAIELKHTRYIVLVTESDVKPPEDAVSGLIRFRHIVVPVHPRDASIPRPTGGAA